MIQTGEAASGSQPVPFSQLGTEPVWMKCAEALQVGSPSILSSVAAPAWPFVAASLARRFSESPVLVVTDGLKSQEMMHQDANAWLQLSGQRRRCLFFPSWEVLPHENKLPHADVISDRLEVLLALAERNAEPPLVVTSVAALLQPTFTADFLRQRVRTLARGQVIEPLDLVEWLEDQAYEPEARVTLKGELSLRGGILDVFPLTSPWPIRLEFFGNEIESLRFFDPGTQVSREKVERVQVGPAGELGILKQLQRHARLVQEQGGSSPPLPLASLFSYLPPQAVVLWCHSQHLETVAAEYTRQIPPGETLSLAWSSLRAEAEVGYRSVDLREDWSSEGTPLPGLEFESLEAFRPVTQALPEPEVAEMQRREFFQQLHRWRRQGMAVHVVCNNAGESQRFNEIWREYDLDAARETELDTAPPSVYQGAVSRGFLCDQLRLVVVTDAEIFGRYKVQRPRRLKSAHAVAARSALDIDFTELDEGDYVVHVQHGIGRFLGLKAMPPPVTRKGETHPLADAGQECLVIEYAPSGEEQFAPRLYVPITEAHLVSKYVGAGKARPPLHTLGGNRWSKAKAQAEKAVRDVAAELLSIQAARETQVGFTCQPDNAWQREFESAFLYEETVDQLKAIQETKGDMESTRPMDRLICGDVGYGKTEVAIRAAFKAVMSGKQVAILVPTTVLAQQHFNTFRERMLDYPIRVEMLSRFRSRKEHRQVLASLSLGGVDIVIGTHRLLQKDVQFKELGLVVIDEEQRFGVLHKERFKMLRRMVDVLTLSATPIPRTLYLALSGARDMSTIQTPPQDRLPVETIVSQYDERLIKEAVQRELNRQGQVFFLHNRVFDIETVAARVRALVPRARVMVGHGQMSSDELEEVMTRFVNGEADVLLSTTIIESGIDIPNANTIIIDRADRFGLSDLYQLRGRVGRYKHQAYAYLMLPRHAELLSDARKRISAIRQYSSLGSGFKIAMRDLEIRGAGNLLGAEQSGYITAVGFDLYCQLLKQSVAALKGEKVPPRITVGLRLDFLARSLNEAPAAPPPEEPEERTEDFVVNIPRDVMVWESEGTKLPGEDSSPARAIVPPAPACLPLSYISDSRQRIEVYRKLAQLTDKTALERLGAELRDRFGPLPEAVELLLASAELKLLAAEKAVTDIECREGRLMIIRNGDYVMLGDKFPRLVKTTPNARLREIKRLLLVL
jgi:transcription-repair coupling factor (superfamily II helicase)